MTEDANAPPAGPAPDFRTPALDEAGVEQFARDLATGIHGGEVVLLEGPLGAGKTFFTRALAAALGVTHGVSSPTYVLMNIYATPGPLKIHHFDFYRLNNSREAEALGLEDFVGRDSLVVVEWPDRCPGAFEAFTMRLRFQPVGDDRRILSGWWGTLPFDRRGLGSEASSAG